MSYAEGLSFSKVTNGGCAYYVMCSSGHQARIFSSSWRNTNLHGVHACIMEHVKPAGIDHALKKRSALLADHDPVASTASSASCSSYNTRLSLTTTIKPM